MKKHSLLLFVLLFASNGLLDSKNPENIPPASIRNIEKSVDNRPKGEPNPASFKNIKRIKEESRGSKTNFTSKIQKIVKTSSSMVMEEIENCLRLNIENCFFGIGIKVLHKHNYISIKIAVSLYRFSKLCNNMLKIRKDLIEYSIKESFIRSVTRFFIVVAEKPAFIPIAN